MNKSWHRAMKKLSNKATFGYIYLQSGLLIIHAIISTIPLFLCFVALLLNLLVGGFLRARPTRISLDKVSCHIIMHQWTTNQAVKKV